jgi:tetratricopeptide (TPR) repeat protein
MLPSRLLTAVLALTLSQPVLAQGFSEYGALLGGQGKPSAGYANTVNQTYSRAASNAAAPQRASVTSYSSRPRIDADTAMSYGKQSNDHYLHAQKMMREGKNCEAIRSYSHALVIRQNIWGDSDPACAELLRQQAELYRKKGEWHNCEINYRRILAIKVKRYGVGAQELEAPLSKLAELCDMQCNNTDALSYYQQLLAIRRKYEAPDSPGTKSVRLKLASTLAVTYDFPAAESLLKEAMDLESNSPKPDNVYLCKVLDTYGGLLREQYRTDEATKMESRQRSIQEAMQNEKTLGPKASLTPVVNKSLSAEVPMAEVSRNK